MELRAGCPFGEWIFTQQQAMNKEVRFNITSQLPLAKSQGIRRSGNWGRSGLQAGHRADGREPGGLGSYLQQSAGSEKLTLLCLVKGQKKKKFNSERLSPESTPPQKRILKHHEAAFSIKINAILEEIIFEWEHEKLTVFRATLLHMKSSFFPLLMHLKARSFQ